MEQLEFFGNETQLTLQQRYYRLWPYLKAHPRLSFVGRTIGLDDPRLDEVENISGLTMELGFLALAFTRPTIVDELRSALEADRLNIGIWQHLMSNERTMLSCQSVVAAVHLPPDYRIERVSAGTHPRRGHKLNRFV